jgi:hypothetical protein
MRGKLGSFLLGLGAFLLVAGLLLRFYAYPRVAVAPIDQDSTSTLVGPDATVFDIATLKEIQTDLTTTARTVGDIKASKEAGDDVRVWVNTSSTKDSDGVVRSRSLERAAFGTFTGEAVNCCGEFYSSVEGEEKAVEHHGLVFKFPFNTQKKTYDFWDSTLLKAVPIDYVETGDVLGTKAYKFEHTIEPTVTGTVEVPASVLGEPGEGNLEAERVYSNVRTLWVEPETGVVLKRSEAQDNTLRYDGEDRVTTTKVTTGYDDATVKYNVDEYGGMGRLLKLVRITLPVAFVILGLLAVSLGVFFSPRRRTEAAHSRAHAES